MKWRRDKASGDAAAALRAFPLRRSGGYATYRGQEYSAIASRSDELATLTWHGRGAPPPEFSVGAHPGEWVKRVPVDQLDALDTIRVRCRWRDHEFAVADLLDDGTVALDYLDSDRGFTWIGAGAVQEVRRGVWMATVPAEELTDVREERTDRLAVLLDEFRGGPGIFDSVLDALLQNLTIEAGENTLSGLAGQTRIPGWRIVETDKDGRSRRRIEMRLQGVSGELIAPDHPVGRAPDPIAMIFTVADGGSDLATAAAVVIRRLGRVATIVDGPALRWYEPGLRYELDRPSGGAGQLRLTLASLPWCEDDEHRSLAWGAFSSPPYLWRADMLEWLPNGTRISSGLRAESWDEFAMQLPWLFDSWRVAAAALPDEIGSVIWTIALSADTSTYVQGWFSADEAVVEIARSQQRLAATRDNAREVAEATLRTIAAWGVTEPDELAARTFLTTRRVLTVPGLGLQTMP